MSNEQPPITPQAQTAKATAIPLRRVVRDASEPRTPEVAAKLAASEAAAAEAAPDVASEVEDGDDTPTEMPEEGDRW